MRRTAALILLSLILCGCSARVEHIPVQTTSSPDAVDINTASVDDLERLPHIGRRTAESIVAFRAQNGPFRRVEHLLLIRGVSEDRFNELRPLICVN
jgi:competence protein ComEA